MNRSLTSGAALLATAALCAVPAHAATKKKPKPIRGSYTLQLPPDPSANVLSTAGQPGQCGVNTAAQDRHPFTAPAAGTLELKLHSEDPAPGTPYVFDWDVFILDSAGDVAEEGTSSAADEDVVLKLKKAEQLLFLTCNLNGLPDATVSYTFTYR